MEPSLSVKIGRLKLNNPVLVCSGTFGYAEELEGLININRLGAIVSKTITLKPCQGNPPPRTCETPAGMLNSIGLENPGLEVFIRDKLPKLSSFGIPVIVSIAAKNKLEEWTIIAKHLDSIKTVAAIELNISCPNVGSKDRLEKLIAQNPKETARIVRLVRRNTSKPLITKLSPNVTDITEIALAAQMAGSDALSLINTVMGMSIDIKEKRPKIANIIGGLSGPAIRPIALRMVWQVYKSCKIPIIGMGGIMDWQNALEFFLAGATAVAVGTANFINPNAAEQIIMGIKDYLKKHNYATIRALIGGLKV